MSDRRPRQFIVRVRESYAVSNDYNVIRVLATEVVATGNGTATERVYICLAEEVTFDAE